MAFALLVFAGPILFLPHLHTISGTIHDGNRMIAGAHVRFQGLSRFTTTDAQGRFAVPFAKGPLIAAQEGFFLANVQGCRTALERLPTIDHRDYVWKSPNECRTCHGAIFEEWVQSGHARAANGTRFLASFDQVLREYPDGSGVCASCHAPTLRSPSLEYDVRMAQGVDRQGVHCDFCHKVADASEDPRGLRFGKDGLSLLRPSPEKPHTFGPLEDAVRPGERFAALAVYRESRYCASCHEGVIFGVHVYGTYTEWLASPAKAKGQSCQSCHMAPTGRMTNIAPGHGGVERDPRSLANHGLPGSSLLERALQINVARHDARSIQVTVRADGVGHQVPTGHLDRNILVVVEALDASGTPVSPAKGELLPPFTGEGFAGKAGMLLAKVYRDESGPLPFWKPGGEIVDRRLHPGKSEMATFRFDGEVHTVRVRVIYRRDWRDAGRVVREVISKNG